MENLLDDNLIFQDYLQSEQDLHTYLKLTPLDLL